MSLHPDFDEAVQRLHPGVSFVTDVIVEDMADGKGRYVAAWNLPGAPPTDAEIAAAMAVVPVPATATKRQVLLWLLTAGKTEADVLAAIAAIPAPLQRAAAQIEWDYPDAGMIHRAHPLVGQIGAVFGLTPAQIDDGYRAAVSL